MPKLIIVSRNLISAANLLNDCVGKIPSLRTIAIFTSIKELESFAKNYPRFDFVLFDNIYFEEDPNRNYDIITISNFKTPVKRYATNKLAISNDTTPEFKKKQIENFTKKVTMDIIKRKATKILLDLGFNFKHAGCKFIAECVCFSYVTKCDSAYESLEKDIYPYIAKLHHTKVSNIKWSVSRAINYMYLNHSTKSFKKVEEYFCLGHMEKPTPKQVIGMIRNKILVENSPTKSITTPIKQENYIYK